MVMMCQLAGSVDLGARELRLNSIEAVAADAGCGVRDLPARGVGP